LVELHPHQPPTIAGLVIVVTGRGTTYGLTVGVRTGVQIAQPGDSGAPVYQPNGSTGATINGLLVGASYDEISFHLVSTVKAQLGVAVAL